MTSLTLQSPALPTELLPVIVIFIYLFTYEIDVEERHKKNREKFTILRREEVKEKETEQCLALPPT